MELALLLGHDKGSVRRSAQEVLGLMGVKGLEAVADTIAEHLEWREDAAADEAAAEGSREGARVGASAGAVVDAAGGGVANQVTPAVAAAIALRRLPPAVLVVHAAALVRLLAREAASPAAMGAARHTSDSEALLTLKKLEPPALLPHADALEAARESRPTTVRSISRTRTHLTLVRSPSAGAPPLTRLARRDGGPRRRPPRQAAAAALAASPTRLRSAASSARRRRGRARQRWPPCGVRGAAGCGPGPAQAAERGAFTHLPSASPHDLTAPLTATSPLHRAAPRRCASSCARSCACCLQMSSRLSSRT